MLGARRFDPPGGRLGKTFGLEGISKSQVSALARALDAEVAAFRSRPLAGGPYPYLWLDAMAVKAREEGRVTSVATVIATAVSADGHREILGLDTFTSEDQAAWTRFLKDLSARGLSGVKLVISDDHKGLTGAIAAVLPGASWQRCRTHFMKNLTFLPGAHEAYSHCSQMDRGWLSCCCRRYGQGGIAPRSFQALRPLIGIGECSLRKVVSAQGLWDVL